ncbi:MAG: hypothetical protein K0Q79_2652 [Flavipsychrobacter sp.]|jgi:hypothetical protein|nr:hypothetical protein [Flavipsychrobacter sp.]
MTYLKQISSYCLILIVLLYTTPLQQFLKVPALIDHYHEHKQQKPDITFVDFIFMHYIGDDGVADDDSKDMQLPFKKSDRASLEAYGYVVTTLPLQTGHELTGTHYSPFKRQFFPDPSAGALFKPPQV